MKKLGPDCLKQDNPPNPPYQGGRIRGFSGAEVMIV